MVTDDLELSVILCVHNGAATVGEQLDALVAQVWNGRWEILVVEHDCTDGTPQVLVNFVAAHPDVPLRIVPARGTRGLSFARNAGVSSTSAAAVAFVDDDDLVGEGWVAAMGNALREHPVVACRLVWDLAPHGSQARAGVFQRDGVEHLFGYPVAAGVGGWQRWLWNALGGNDESLTFTGEDFDMSIRAFLEHGITPYFAEDAVYHVARRDGLRAEFKQARSYGKASVVLYRRYGRGRVDRRVELVQSMKSWGWLAVHSLELRGERAARWVRLAGTRVGRLEQSIKSRVLWP